MKFANVVARTLLGTNGPCAYRCTPPSILRPPMITFSGTVSFGDILDDIQIQRQKCPGGTHVHAGFANRAKRILSEPEVDSFVKKYDDIIFGGYSLGGAVAVITAYLSYIDLGCKVRGVYTFGAPAVGDSQFVEQYEKLFANRTYRYTLSHDIIPKSNFRYEHVGKHIVLDYDGNSVIDNHQLTRYASSLNSELDVDGGILCE